MNYYRHHIGDYLRDTAHLTVVEDGVYRRLLDLYYTREQPLPSDISVVCRLIRIRDPNECAAVDTVLREFFTLEDDGLWHQQRADSEISIARDAADRARENGKRGGNPLKKAGYNEPGVLYGVQAVDGGPVKVGITKHPAQRMSQLRAKHGAGLRIAFQIQVANMGSVEAAVHSAFDHCRDGEWIACQPDEIQARITELMQAEPHASCMPAPTQVGSPLHDSRARPSPIPQPPVEDSVTDVTGAVAPRALPPKDFVFLHGLSLLTSTGMPEPSARSFLGKCCAAHGDAATAAAVDEAIRCSAGDPLPYIRKVLSAATNGVARISRQQVDATRRRERNADVLQEVFGP